MKSLTKYFLNGLAVLVPVVATVYVIYAVFVRVDSLFRFPVPGMGFLITIAAITLIGFAASNFLARWLVHLVDRIFSRLPFVKMIYNSIKDLIGAFVGDKKGFNKPVTVALSPDGAVKAMGFVTSESLGHLGLEGSVAVYLPQSYNFAGNLIMVPTDRVTPLDTDSGELMAFIVSGGIAKK